MLDQVRSYGQFWQSSRSVKNVPFPVILRNKKKIIWWVNVRGSLRVTRAMAISEIGFSASAPLDSWYPFSIFPCLESFTLLQTFTKLDICTYSSAGALFWYTALAIRLTNFQEHGCDGADIDVVVTERMKRHTQSKHRGMRYATFYGLLNEPWQFPTLQWWSR